MKSPFFRTTAHWVGVVILSALLANCNKNGTGPEPDLNADIPMDPNNVTVPTPVVNNLKPAATFEKTAGNESRIRVTLQGMLDPTNNYLPIAFTAHQNLYVTEDGVVKGILVQPVGNNNVLSADVAFIVDNSGSMAQEADSVANSIASFATRLAGSGLDVRFSCVGYDALGDISGAINATTASRLSAYLNRPFLRGTSRTYGFAGADSVSLATTASGFAPQISGENGVVAIFFAEQMFSWRTGAQRVYINFTDEPTQPNGYAAWATQAICQQLGGRATIHTVWSGGDTTFFRETALVAEKPWRMSHCTGGTIKVVPSSAANLNLADLPVTQALENSYLVEFVSANPGAAHTIAITVKSSERADGRTVYENVLY